MTIFFSDIVTFTNIAAVVAPIDIVNLLNDLYLRFDNCTSRHDVFKVKYAAKVESVLSNIK